MGDVKLTSRRQVTLPAQLCEELGLRPGDRIRVERKVVGGETLWVLRRARRNWACYGSARKYARGKTHALTDIRRNIERGWSGDRDR